jgi:hypothetical protein
VKEAGWQEGQLDSMFRDETLLGDLKAWCSIYSRCVSPIVLQKFDWLLLPAPIQLSAVAIVFNHSSDKNGSVIEQTCPLSRMKNRRTLQKQTFTDESGVVYARLLRLLLRASAEHRGKLISLHRRFTARSRQTSEHLHAISQLDDKTHIVLN